MSTEPSKEMTWTRAVVIGLSITLVLIITLGFIPSIFTYEWEKRTDDVLRTIKDLTGRDVQRYTTVRLRDAISMGFQTVFFVIPVAATYIVMERRRRRLGQRGFEGVKEYMAGK